MSSLSGWAAHCTFGLRREWLGLVLREPSLWATVGGLGPRQVQSLARWLQTAGLYDRQRETTPLYHLFEVTWPEAELAWQLLWVNVTFVFPTARWYVQRMGLGEWDTAQLRASLQSSIPRLAARTVANAMLELVGLLERTAVGDQFGQGRVFPGRPRRVQREGLLDIARPALLHSARQLFLAKRRSDLPSYSDVLWLWAVFGCPFEVALPQLTMGGTHWLALDEQGLHCLVTTEALRHVALF